MNKQRCIRRQMSLVSYTNGASRGLIDLMGGVLYLLIRIQNSYARC